MNICAGGYAGCHPGTEYPKILDEVVARVRANDVSAVTPNEACSGDVAELAARTGYHYRFAAVIHRCAPLACKSPGAEGSSATPCRPRRRSAPPRTRRSPCSAVWRSGAGCA